VLIFRILNWYWWELYIVGRSHTRICMFVWVCMCRRTKRDWGVDRIFCGSSL